MNALVPATVDWQPKEQKMLSRGVAAAALIAAAPELYEALRALVNSFKPLGLGKAAPFSPLARARKALSKAEGR